MMSTQRNAHSFFESSQHGIFFTMSGFTVQSSPVPEVSYLVNCALNSCFSF